MSLPRSVPLAAMALVALAAAGPAGGIVADAPGPPSGAEDVHRFSRNLDGDRAREQVLVWQTGGLGPTTSFSVWNRRADRRWETAQIEDMLTNPGSGDPGLRQAWARDLNRDGRVEIAARNFITPSVGEVLVIYRQRRRRSLEFTRLQTIGGDRVTVSVPRRGSASVHVLIEANHAADNRRHDSLWRWSSRADQWTCRRDCSPLAGGAAPPRP